jgi:NADH-quinone oxidoreductase subunit N
VLALTGLAGLPPGLAGLFAKVAVVRSLLDGAAGWLAIVVGLNAVIGLAYYLRATLALFATPPPEPVSAPALPVRAPVPVAVSFVLVVLAMAAVVVGFAPQTVLDFVAAS